MIHSTEESRNAILVQMQILCKTLPEYSVVRDMNCIGDILIPCIIAEIGDVCRFKNKHFFIAHAGIDAPPYQSGAFNSSERKISKWGNSYLRKTGYEIMQSLIKQKPTDDSVYDFIQKKRSEGKCGKEAMIAGLSKFLRVYYGGSWNCTLNCNLFRKHIYNRCLKLCFHTSALLSPVFNTAFLQLSFQHLNFGYFCRLIFLSRFRLISIHTLCEEGDKQ